MRWILTLESFISRLPKKIFVSYYKDMFSFGRGDSKNNYKLDNMLIKSIFDDIVILEEMDLQQVKEWVKTINSGDKVFCYATKILDTENPKYEILDYVYKSLNKKKDIDFWMNDNFTRSKQDYYNLLKDYDFMPKTCFSKEEAMEILNFPIVAKPDGGTRGYGIQKFDTKKELENSLSEFDVYSEYVNHISEIRVFVLNGKIIYIFERINKFKTKNNIDNKTKDSRISFVYIPQEMNNFPYTDKIQEVVDIVDKKLGSHTGSIYSIDMFITPEEEIKVIESNSESRIDPFTFIEIFNELFDIPEDVQSLMNDARNMYLKSEYEQFEKQINKSINPVSYDTRPVDKTFAKKVKNYSHKTL